MYKKSCVATEIRLPFGISRKRINNSGQVLQSDREKSVVGSRMQLNTIRWKNPLYYQNAENKMIHIPK